VHMARALDKPLAVSQIGDVRNTLLPDASREAGA
jgi:hypothetical protein